MALAALAVAADLPSLTLPAAANAVWRGEAPRPRPGRHAAVARRRRHHCRESRRLHRHQRDVLAGRQTSSIERSLILDRIARLQAERTASPKAAPSALSSRRSATRPGPRSIACGASCVARQRDQIDAELAGLSATIRTLPAVSGAADPLAAAISGMVSVVTGGRIVIADEALARIRVMLLLALPLLGGLALAIGAALAGREANGRRHDRHAQIADRDRHAATEL